MNTSSLGIPESESVLKKEKEIELSIENLYLFSTFVNWHKYACGVIISIRTQKNIPQEGQVIVVWNLVFVCT